MSDEAQSEPETLDEYFAQAMAKAELGGTEDDEDGSSGSSEEDGDGDLDVQATDDGDDPSDDDGAPEEEPAPPKDTVSRMALKLRDREQELTKLRASTKALEEEVKRLSDGRRQEEAEPEDIVEHVRDVVARRLKLKADDPQLRGVLADLVADMTAEFVEGADAIEAFKDRKSARAKRVAEDAKYRELRERLDRAERAELEARRHAFEQGQINVVGEFLAGNKEAFPFLMGQKQVNPVETIVELFNEGRRQGRVSADTDEEAVEILRTMAGNLDAHYREIYEELHQNAAGRLGKGATATTVQGKAKKQTPQKRTGTASGNGGGGRGAPAPVRDDDEEETFESFMRKEMHRQRTLQRKGR